MSQDVVTDVVVRQLGDILIATPAGSSGVKPINPLDSLWFWTKPRATDTPDVCQTDRVVFEFTPTHRGVHDADSPTRVSGVSAASRFHLLEIPSPEPREQLTDTGRRSLENKCADLNPEDIHAISARSAEEVREGAKLFVRTMAYLFAPSSEVERDCMSLNQGCRQFRDLAFADVEKIGPCESTWSDRPAECTRFDAGNARITVLTSWRDDEGKIIAGNEKRILKAKLQEILVLWHERID